MLSELTKRPGKFLRPGGRTILFSTFFLILAGKSLGQNTSAPGSGSSGMVRPGPGSGTSQIGAFFSPFSVIPFFNRPWGPLTSANYSFTYGTGIQSQPGQSEDTIIQSLSLGTLFPIGTHWSIIYTPIMTFYSSEGFKDTLNHSVVLTGSATYERWSFGLSQSYNKSADPLIETGTQTEQELFSTGLTADYLINSKASLNFSLSHSIRSAEGFNNSRDWGMAEGFKYKFWPRFSAGLSLSAGYSDVSQGSDMTYEQLSAHATWEPTDKLSASVNVGAETRQFLSTKTDMLINPTFGATLSYQPVDATRISLSANRGVGASYFANEIVESTTLSVGVQQQLLEHFHLGVNGGYHTSTFKSSEPGLAITREDDGFNFGITLGFSLFKRTTISIFYNYSENSSSQGDFVYSSNQIGFTVGYRF